MARKHSYPADLADTVIARDLAVKGDLSSDNDILIDGTVDGQIVTHGNLSVGQSAVINGPLQGRSVAIAGQVRGNVEGSESITLEASAHVEGDISTPQLTVAPGAYLQGQVTMRESTESS